MTKASDYKVVRENSPPRYFQSFTDACEDSDKGLEKTKIIPLYESKNASGEDNLLTEISYLRTVIGLLKNDNKDHANDVTLLMNDVRCLRYGCNHENQLQWKWRNVETLPEEFDYMECEAAILDAFIRQGGANVWSGDGSACATQIVEAVWKRMKIAEDRIKELENNLKEQK